MSEYDVTFYEVHEYTVRVVADSVEAARVAASVEWEDYGDAMVEAVEDSVSMVSVDWDDTVIVEVG